MPPKNNFLPPSSLKTCFRQLTNPVYFRTLSPCVPTYWGYCVAIFVSTTSNGFVSRVATALAKIKNVILVVILVFTS